MCPQSLCNERGILVFNSVMVRCSLLDCVIDSSA